MYDDGHNCFHTIALNETISYALELCHPYNFTRDVQCRLVGLTF